jgi:PIN domain nuclease of toxin-antitoxin system
MNSKYILDASVLLVLINKEPGHEKVFQYLPEACVSTVNLSEVASVLHNINIPAEQIREILENLVTKVLVFDKSQAYETAQLRSLTRSLGLSLGDRACLALGKLYNMTVLTADKIWSKLDLGLTVIQIR